MFATTPKSQTTVKKSRRSTSPRAVELRRLQNRIAQRNHRRKIREASQARQQTDDTSISEENGENQQTGNNKGSDERTLSQQQVSTNSSLESPVKDAKSPTSASSYPDSPPFGTLASELENMIMAEDMLAQQEQSLTHMDLMMNTVSENENRMPLSNFTHQNCTCSAATGPCFNHLEKIRAQLLAEMNSPLQLHQQQQQQQQQHQHQQNQQNQYQQHQSHHIANSNIARAHTLSPSPTSNYSHSTSSESSQRPLYRPNGSTRVEQPPHSPSITSKSSEFSFNMSNHMSLPRDLSLTTQTDAQSEPFSTKSRARSSTTSAAENTRRFGIVLEAMSTAGFPDFDSMALAYYTARFEVGSFPAMAQCASRSRRMKAMLQELQESSGQWPRWESRGLHESVSQATVSLCLEEIERLNKSQMPNQPLQSEPASFITAFECLLESRGQGNLSILEELKMSGKVEAALDEMPYLWSLLTELSGPRGLYCDRIAKIVMVVLLYARRT